MQGEGGQSTSNQVVGELVKVLSRLSRFGFKRVVLIGVDGKPIQGTAPLIDKAIKIVESGQDVLGIGVEPSWYRNRYFDVAVGALIISDVKQASQLLDGGFIDWRIRLCSPPDSFCIRTEDGKLTVLFRYPRVYHIVATDPSGRLVGKASKLGVELITNDLVVVYRVGDQPVRWNGRDWALIDVGGLGAGIVLGERDTAYLVNAFGIEYY